MKTNILLQRIVFGIFTIVVPLTFLLTGSHSVRAQIGNSPCPKPFIKQLASTGECVLTKDVVLRQTLVLVPNTTLNCQSHSILANSFLSPTPKVAIPKVAIFLNGASAPTSETPLNIQIKNCVISGFDFGIFAINNKRQQLGTGPPVRLSILNNIITARFTAISLMSVDDAEITGNTIEWQTRGGRALYVGRDSDHNAIRNNKIGATIEATGNALRAPGPEGPSNTAVADGSAILITQIEGGEPTLLNIFIGNFPVNVRLCPTRICLFQVLSTASINPDSTFSQDNILDGNTVTIRTSPTTVRPVDGIVLAVPLRTRVTGNTIDGARVAIRPGIQFGPKQFPGRCSTSGRFCLLGTEPSPDRDCNIRGFDPPAVKDTCTLLPAKTDVRWLSLDTIIENNIIRGSTDTGISVAGEGSTIIGNILTGINRNDIGIRLTGKLAVEGDSDKLITTITRNTVRNFGSALGLIQIFPSPPSGTDKVPLAVNFNARVFLNDFTCYDTAVLLLGKGASPPPPPFPPPSPSPYNLTTVNLLFSELSNNSQGNYWGSGGFVAANVKENTAPLSVSTFAKDSHPFGAPVVNPSAAVPCP